MRGLRRITAVLFVVSSLFPVVAGLLAANPRAGSALPTSLSPRCSPPGH